MAASGSPKRVMVIYGTRPEAIKLAPVIHAIHASCALSPIVTLTGQHRAIVNQVNSLFGIRPDHDLNVIKTRQSLDGLTSRVLERVTRPCSRTGRTPSSCKVTRRQRSPVHWPRSTSASR